MEVLCKGMLFAGNIFNKFLNEHIFIFEMGKLVFI